MNIYPSQRARRTPRLDGYDYSQAGLYFITICTKNRESLFGAVVNEAMQRNQYGEIVAEEWLLLPQRYAIVSVADFVVMPNHFHSVLEISQRPEVTIPLSMVVGSFKSGIARRINLLRARPGQTVWQRSFHDRIVHNEDELIRIQQYIANNPLRWALDEENPHRTSLAT